MRGSTQVEVELSGYTCTHSIYIYIFTVFVLFTGHLGWNIISVLLHTVHFSYFQCKQIHIQNWAQINKVEYDLVG